MLYEFVQELDKYAEEEVAKGKLMARGFAAELEKIVEQIETNVSQQRI